MQEMTPQNVLLMTKTGNTDAQLSSIDFEAYGRFLKKRYEARALQKQQRTLPEMPKVQIETTPDSKIKNNRDRINAQFNAEISIKDIHLVLKAEEEIRQCQNCTGLPCKKIINQFFIPQIGYSEFSQQIVIRNEFCTYEKARRLQSKIERLQGLSKIPPEYVGKTFEDYQVDAANSYAVQVAKALIDKPNDGAYFFGGVGTGKTLLAAILAQEIIKRGRQVIFATVPNISKQIRSTFNGNSKTTEAEILSQLETVPTLILDDVGIEKPTRFLCSVICNLFNERYNARLQTIMTSNYRLKQLEYIYNHPSDEKEETLDGTRIYDRCKTMCAPVEFKGASRR